MKAQTEFKRFDAAGLAQTPFGVCGTYNVRNGLRMPTGHSIKPSWLPTAGRRTSAIPISWNACWR
jgi:hypothetical protein